MGCLGKLFNSVLNNRLDEYLSENNIISETQIGFKKKSKDIRPYFCFTNVNREVYKAE